MSKLNVNWDSTVGMQDSEDIAFTQANYGMLKDVGVNY